MTAKRSETLNQATYTDVNGERQEMFTIESSEGKIVVRNLFDKTIASQFSFPKGFESTREAWDWMCKTQIKDLL